MRIIPVIDLKDGTVVRAERGDRATYRPIITPLAASSAIDDVIHGLLQLYPFDKFYLADLNAITGQGNHDRPIRETAARHPHLEFWLDNGCRLPCIANDLPTNIKPVFGTESQTMTPQQIAEQYILSLDFKNGRGLGAAAWFENPRYWPQTVIAMTLDAVGTDNGPDIEKLRELRRMCPDKCWVAAGGIRDTNDLTALARVGINQALVSSALHAGRICASDIENLRAKKYPV